MALTKTNPWCEEPKLEANPNATEIGKVGDLRVWTQTYAITLSVGISDNGIDMNSEHCRGLIMALQSSKGGSCGTSSGLMLRVSVLAGGVEIKRGTNHAGWILASDQARLLVGYLERAIELVEAR